jgi:hypothetical protein
MFLIIKTGFTQCTKCIGNSNFLPLFSQGGRTSWKDSAVAAAAADEKAELRHRRRGFGGGGDEASRLTGHHARGNIPAGEHCGGASR